MLKDIPNADNNLSNKIFFLHLLCCQVMLQMPKWFQVFELILLSLIQNKMKKRYNSWKIKASLHNDKEYLNVFIKEVLEEYTATPLERMIYVALISKCLDNLPLDTACQLPAFMH